MSSVVAHMLFLILAFMWSGIFAAAVGSIQWFGLSAFVHILIISGIMITFTIKVLKILTLSGYQQ